MGTQRHILPHGEILKATRLMKITNLDFRFYLRLGVLTRSFVFMEPVTIVRFKT